MCTFITIIVLQVAIQSPGLHPSLWRVPPPANGRIISSSKERRVGLAGHQLEVRPLSVLLSFFHCSTFAREKLDNRGHRVWR